MLLVINLSSKWNKWDVECECALQTSRSSINVTANIYRVPTLKSEEKAGQKPETGRPVRRAPQSTKEKAGWEEPGEGWKWMIAVKWERNRRKGKTDPIWHLSREKTAKADTEIFRAVIPMKTTWRRVRDCIFEGLSLKCWRMKYDVPQTISGFAPQREARAGLESLI